MTIKRNPASMSKADEKKLYREFILATPESSYLRTVLNDSREFVFGNIDNDIAWPVWKRSRQIDRDIAKSKKELTALKTSAREAKEELLRIQREAREARREHDAVLRTTEHFLDSIAEETRSIARKLHMPKKDNR